MLKKIFLHILLLVCYQYFGWAQETIYPAKKQEGTLVIKNGTVHTGTGTVLKNAHIVVKDGKIVTVSQSAVDEVGATVIDATGKNVYPGLILTSSDLGLKEISSGVRGSNDYYELGQYNSAIQSIYAYNADSRMINTLRANGVLLAGVTPSGSLLTGASSVVQLDAWTWQDALYASATGMHLHMPSLYRSMRGGRTSASGSNPVKEGIKLVEQVEQFLAEAQAYIKQHPKPDVNLKFEMLRPLFEKKQKLFVHADRVRQILMAIDFAKKFDIEVVIIGGADSYLVADLLKKNNISVVLNTLHELPTLPDDDIDQPFKTPAILQRAGVLFALNDNSSSARYRNLAFNAGTAVAYGLTKEQALQAITLNPAKILGIDKQAGSIEVGKDANIVICEGDILDMKSSIITNAFIQGRKIDLSNKQTQLYERYKYRYNLQ
jgi:Imidazolonepropionase and related amidohydrolases